ncbi:MAG: RagB/SusD family nutrient uptake outer membrane protein [Bacteroidota bacterium]|nr:RagB/SusD family nutrient uptake outer membrane protein [Bacteroidota bacterium]
MKHIKNWLALFLIVVLFSCTKLNESFRSELEQNNSASITPAQLLKSAYNTLYDYTTQGNLWSASEISSDEAIAPTRGPDWDDNGLWRALHTQAWNADHDYLAGAFNSLLGSQFAASNVLQFSPSPQQAAEAKFIRALSMYEVLDGWDQVPYREDLSNYKILPKTLKGLEVVDFVTGELNAIMKDLPNTGPAYTANQNAARALLMKIYLNKGVYANRAAPTFAAADMSQVITLADQIIASNNYSLNTNFFDIFAPDNDVKATENIFTLYDQNGDRGGNVQASTFAVSHYNMNPGGWNGFSTLSNFYDKFEATDQRRGMYYNYPAGLPNPGHRVNVGFLIGQQYNLTTDVPLNDRKGNPLAFTKTVALRETGSNLEVTGIRVIKYPYDYPHKDAQNNNDYVIFRLGDVMLMKAEAQLRNGDATGALVTVNTIRVKRGATPLVSLSPDDLYDERGREMYWEGWRRNDQIRFGKYLGTWVDKPATDAHVLLFPIPSSQLAVNPNLSQNPGY